MNTTIVKTLCSNVTKSKIRKEEDEVGLTATGVYFLKHKVTLPALYNTVSTFTFTFSHLADAFIQSDLQLGST